MAKKTLNLKTTIYTQFYNFDYSQQILRENSVEKEDKYDELNESCKLLLDRKMNFASLDKSKQFELIKLDNYDLLKNDAYSDKEKLVFSIEQRNDQYTVSTGLYCGMVHFGEKMPSIEITADVSDVFFKRILNFCCGIYAETSTKDRTSKNESIYSLLVQYLFLISLRKVAGKSFPKKYISKKGRGYDIKGEIDIESYVNKDLLMFDKKLSYKYQTMKDIQNIIDVLYEATKKCEISKNSELPEVAGLKIYLNDNYSHKKCSKGLIKNILKEKALLNSLYSDFKQPLQCAQILLNNEELNSGKDSKINGISGYLVDASFLWEMYLYNLMRLHLTDWDIVSQAELSFYDNTFFGKKNYPDFVLRNKHNRKIFVLDAKFKKMRYSGLDVDNDDIRQLHAYSYYFHLTEGDRFAGAGLIYPTKIDRPHDKNNVDNIYGVETTNNKFGVFTIKDPDTNKCETIVENEKKFINELKNFLQ